MCFKKDDLGMSELDGGGGSPPENDRFEDGVRARAQGGPLPDNNLWDRRGFPAALFSAIPGSLLVIDAEHRVRLMNDLLGREFGDDGDPAIDLTLGRAVRCVNEISDGGTCGNREACLDCDLRQVTLDILSGEKVHRRRCDLMHTGQDRPQRAVVLASGSPFEYRGEKLAVVFLEDITELTSLRTLLGTENSFAGMVGATQVMSELFSMINEVSGVSAPVLVQGESGTGKELVARAIHDHGPRAHAEFVPVNCGALPDGLLESELFGHVKGAFTGAIRDRKGRFQLADGGTIFLDEVGDLGLTLQVKLLRVLQEGTFEPVGSEKTLSVDVRVVSATNKDLVEEVAAGRFREDLYYRLCVIPIMVPPLRERLADLPLIAGFLLEKAAVMSDGSSLKVSEEATEILLNHHWPGNVRELQNVLQYARVKCRGDLINAQHLPPTLVGTHVRTKRRKKGQTKLTPDSVARALVQTSGNRSEAAKVLGVSRATFYRFLGNTASVD